VNHVALETHSAFQLGDRGPAATRDRAIDAVAEWRAALVSLDAMFAMLCTETAALQIGK
jgi:hypothetical protein